MPRSIDLVGHATLAALLVTGTAIGLDEAGIVDTSTRMARFCIGGLSTFCATGAIEWRRQKLSAPDRELDIPS